MEKIESSLSGLEQSFLQLCQKHPQGLLEDTLAKELPQFSIQERAEAINGLAKKGLLTFLKIGNSVAYQEVRSEEVLKLQGLGAEDRLVYQLVKQADNNGIWTKDLRVRSNLQPTQLTRVLKNLETKKIVKSVKSVENKNKKLYMLFDIEPSRRITGGAWYSEQEFDSEFIEMLQKQAYHFILQKSFPKNKDEDIFPAGYTGYASMEDVHGYIAKTGVSKVTLDVEDIGSILDTLLFDGKIEARGDRYKAIRGKPQRNPGAEIPCGSCPVFKFCSSDGPINPSQCEYYNAWLDLD